LNKKLLLIPLAILLAISLVVIGCPGTPTTTAPPPPTKTTAPPPTTTAPPPPPEPIELTFGGLYPPSHPFSMATVEWIDKINKETDGQVTITPYWAAALYASRESATELGKGVADTGDFSGAYAATGFGFEKSARMIFWGVDDRIMARKIYNEVCAEYPELEAEFTDANIKVLAYASVPPYQLITVKKAVRKLDDFKGLILKSTGDLGKLANSLGAEGTTVGMGETYVALQKNTIDGGFVTDETLKSFLFAEVADYYTQLNIASAPAGHWGMCLDVWNKLPPNVQKVFDDNVEWFGLRIEELTFEANQPGIDLAKENGVEFITLSPLDLAFVYAAADTVIREEMAALDAQGFHGTAIYKKMRSLVEEYSD
jgi:TRAP-type C4-dicarboxylate transport system substrate-binding protein